ncbi:MAG TPA: nickel pincer cofactor biosynthesis protein LarB [Candidatus Nanoarchaeia archaeon]|nr:nickel pincer cofactor biosynthesis protein LarB [Candidatus Nanoarchaeia archaeon]
MEQEYLRKVLEEFKENESTIEESIEKLRKLPYEDISFAKVDHHRNLRTGFPEVIFCEGKADEHIIKIFSSLKKYNNNVLLTRASESTFKKLKKIEPKVKYNKLGRTITYVKKPIKKYGSVLIVAAGTADAAVAEEAYETANIMGLKVKRLYDVGVAGLHRLLDNVDKIYGAKCIICIAGMDGACVPTTAGLSRCPVIAVPTSVGYGASFKGLAPLLTMLNSCAPGVSVVNIDNGFGAAYSAALINRQYNK